MSLRFQRVDMLIGAILGEIVGLFAYAIIQKQESAPAVIRDLPIFVFAVGVPIVAVALLYCAYVIGKKVKPVIFQFGKFAAVGFSNTAIDWGVLNLLLPLAASGTSTYASFKGISFAAATLNSFLWNRFWSFEKKGTERIGTQAIQFYIVTAIGLAINVGVATAIVKLTGGESHLINGLAAPAVATACSMVWDFLAYRFIVFRSSTASSGAPSVPPIAATH